MGGKHWQPEEKKLLEELYPVTSNKEISKIMGRTENSVETFALKINLFKSKEYISGMRSVQFTKYTVNHDFFHNIDVPNKAYWMGWLWSDGNIRKNKTSSGNFCYIVRLEIHKEDKKIIELFKECISSENLIFNHYSLVGIHITSKTMFDDLVSHGVIPNKSLLAKEPIGIPDELLPHFIRGVFDGDGCIHVTKRDSTPMVSIFGTKIFCEWLNETIYQQIGFRGNLRDIKSKSGMTWVYGLYARDKATLFADWIYQDCDDFKLERKYQKFAAAGLI